MNYHCKLISSKNFFKFFDEIFFIFIILILFFSSCETNNINLTKIKKNESKIIIIGKWIRYDGNLNTEWSYSQIGILVNFFRRCFGEINNSEEFQLEKNGFFAIQIPQKNSIIRKIELKCINFGFSLFGYNLRCVYSNPVFDLTEIHDMENIIIVLSERLFFFDNPTYFYPEYECKPSKIEKKETKENFLEIIYDFRNKYPEYKYIKKFTLENKQTIFLNN